MNKEDYNLCPGLSPEEFEDILTDQEVGNRLDKRIEWVRLMLGGDISKERSADFQWLLMHLISIKSGELEGEFKIDG